MDTPIVLDIGIALQQLRDNPELGKAMNEMVFGKVANDQIEARDELIGELADALRGMRSQYQLHVGLDDAIANATFAVVDEVLAAADRLADPSVDAVYA